MELKRILKPASPALIRARKRNWAKFQLNGLWARLDSILSSAAYTDSIYDLLQLTQEEFCALNEIKMSVRLVIESWGDNTKILIGR